ncbi:MAG TPA: EscF/YscF/HrpA family type III secretion system needle major subunit [Caulifigura sp.]|jgi:type III secretion apparatus needle protein|nr:EscF/YscF/HrpA family type III secretion system needle major subunit [Caulifigura sp.]
MAFDMGSVNNTLNSTVGNLEGKLRTQLQASQGGDLSQPEMMDLQFQLSKWQLVTNLQSNIMKTLSEAVKGTIQNMR